MGIFTCYQCHIQRWSVQFAIHSRTSFVGVILFGEKNKSSSMKLYIAILLVALTLAAEANYIWDERSYHEDREPVERSYHEDQEPVLQKSYHEDQKPVERSYHEDQEPVLQKRCVGKYGKCTSDGQCCDEKNWAKRKLRCLTQCDEGGCLSYKQCMFYAGIQK